MSDYVNLDDVTTDDEDAEEPEQSDWLSPENTAPSDDRDGGSGPTEIAGDNDSGSGPTDTADGSDGDATDHADTPLPHVPHPDKDKPVGIPTGGGGAGGTAPGQGSNTTAGAAGGDDAATPKPAEASGPHGGDADDMTMALTYEAAKALATPSAAFADANRWADWIGMVGSVPAHTLNKFQRDNHVDLDFFNGGGMEPAERLADIDERSMFYAERLVLVGREDERGLAKRAGWEFVPLSEAAEKAGWDQEE